MTLADDIERLGALAEDGVIGAGDAAHQLIQVNEGGLTMTGARDLIRNWRSARAESVVLPSGRELPATASW